MPPLPKHDIEKVSPNTMRMLFNASEYPLMINNGELEKVILKTKTLQNPGLRHLPNGTKSEIILYRDRARDLFVIIHQYLKPDGTLGASGKPDPKRIKIEGKMYIAST